MISRLRLVNWRNYEDVTITFDLGTTFVVASNGVGKSSLVEAARWALFGVPSAGGTPVRVGSDQASVELDLTLPGGDTLTVERTMTAKVKRGQDASSVSLNGAIATGGVLDGILSESYRTEPAFLAKLAMPAITREQDTPEGLGLEQHLGRYFGVNGLQVAIDTLKDEMKSLEKQISQVKVANSASARQLEELASLLVAARTNADSAAVAHSEAQAVLTAMRARADAAALVDAWTIRAREWATTTGQIETEGREVGLAFSAGEFEAAAGQRIRELSRLVEDARVRRAVCQSRVDSIRTNASRLDDAHEECPVCRRELDEATIALAHQSNETELQSLDAEIARSDIDASLADEEREKLEFMLRRWRGVPQAGPAPEKTEGVASTAADLDSATEQVNHKLNLLVEARTRVAEMDRRLLEATQADAAMKQLEGLFRAEAETKVALEATRETLDELLQQTVRPLESEINVRWKGLFPNRGDLSTRANGAISRTVGGDSLPFDSFSTGEGMGALLVLRLLVAQMATLSDFCWFDEPLEHLDPDVRRQVASILARAADGSGQLRQVVVTTYEEPLARSLEARAPGRVHLVDIRHVG